MPTLRAPLLAAALLSPFAHAEAPPATRTGLGIGTQRLLDARHVHRFAVRDPQLVRAHWVGQVLLAEGVAAGETEVLVFDEHDHLLRFELTVHDVKSCDDSALCDLMPRSGTLRLDPSPPARISGVAESVDALLQAHRLAERYPIAFEARLSERAIRHGLLEIDHALWRAGWLELRATVRAERVELAVEPPEPVRERAENLLREAAAKLQRALDATASRLHPATDAPAK